MIPPVSASEGFAGPVNTAVGRASAPAAPKEHETCHVDLEQSISRSRGCAAESGQCDSEDEWGDWTTAGSKTLTRGPILCIGGSAGSGDAKGKWQPNSAVPSDPQSQVLQKKECKRVATQQAAGSRSVDKVAGRKSTDSEACLIGDILNFLKQGPVSISHLGTAKTAKKGLGFATRYKRLGKGKGSF